MQRPVLVIVAILLLMPLVGSAQQSKNGKGGVFYDPLLDRLVGDWNLTRTIRGTTAESKVTATWVLNHQWLRVEMTSKAAGEYLAEIYIGYDDAKSNTSFTGSIRGAGRLPRPSDRHARRREDRF